MSDDEPAREPLQEDARISEYPSAPGSVMLSEAKNLPSCRGAEMFRIAQHDTVKPLFG